MTITPAKLERLAELEAAFTECLDCMAFADRLDEERGSSTAATQAMWIAADDQAKAMWPELASLRLLVAETTEGAWA